MEPCRELINHVVSGNEIEKKLAIEKLHQLLGENIRKFTRYKFNSQGEEFIEELNQQVWLIVLLKANQARGDTQEALLGWIRTIAFHTGLNMIRDNQKLQDLISLESNDTEDGSPEEEKISTEHSLWIDTKNSWTNIEESFIKKEEITTFLNKLGDRERVIFYLKYYYEYSQAEIAEILNISQPRVTQIIKKIETRNNRN